MGVSHKLEEIEGRIQAALASRVAGRGVVPVSVGLSQLLLPERATTSVIQRMEAIRTGLAEAVRQTGTAEAQAIESKAATEAELIRAFAQQRAADIRSTIDQRAATYMEKMSEEEGLATFLAWLDTLEATLSEQLTVFLDADTQPWHLMKLSTRTDEKGIPQDADHWQQVAAQAQAESSPAAAPLGSPESAAPSTPENP
jgi:regulator of protease activity HflC (stomatin/prohibitin superfamily)